MDDNESGYSGAQADIRGRKPIFAASLRPVRAANALGPTMPRVTAAIAGANTEPLAAASAWVTATSSKRSPGRAGSSRAGKVVLLSGISAAHASFGWVDPAGVSGQFPAGLRGE